MLPEVGASRRRWALLWFRDGLSRKERRGIATGEEQYWRDVVFLRAGRATGVVPRDGADGEEGFGPGR